MGPSGVITEIGPSMEGDTFGPYSLLTFRSPSRVGDRFPTISKKWGSP